MHDLISRSGRGCITPASQIEVQVAQSLVVESALGLLRQIAGEAHLGIKKALRHWDEARREEAAAELLGLGHHLGTKLFLLRLEQPLGARLVCG